MPAGSNLVIGIAIFARSIVSYDASLAHLSDLLSGPAEPGWHQAQAPELVLRRVRLGLSQDPERARGQVKPVARPLYVILPRRA